LLGAPTLHDWDLVDQYTANSGVRLILDTLCEHLAVAADEKPHKNFLLLVYAKAPLAATRAVGVKAVKSGRYKSTVDVYGRDALVNISKPSRISSVASCRVILLAQAQDVDRYDSSNCF
jgi:hypothetical protein